MNKSVKAIGTTARVSLLSPFHKAILHYTVNELDRIELRTQEILSNALLKEQDVIRGKCLMVNFIVLGIKFYRLIWLVSLSVECLLW